MALLGRKPMKTKPSSPVQPLALINVVTLLAPGMGMIGTLLGLVLMMGNMSDPSSIGPGMAVALLTTLYGAVLANVLLGPLVQKIMGYGKRTRRNYELAMAGVLFIHQGGDPRLLPDLLLGNMLPQQAEPEAPIETVEDEVKATAE